MARTQQTAKKTTVTNLTTRGLKIYSKLISIYRGKHIIIVFDHDVNLEPVFEYLNKMYANFNLFIYTILINNKGNDKEVTSDRYTHVPKYDLIKYTYKNIKAWRMFQSSLEYVVGLTDFIDTLVIVNSESLLNIFNDKIFVDTTQQTNSIPASPLNLQQYINTTSPLYFRNNVVAKIPAIKHNVIAKIHTKMKNDGVVVFFYNNKLISYENYSVSARAMHKNVNNYSKLFNLVTELSYFNKNFLNQFYLGNDGVYFKKNLYHIK